ncbi:alanine racemase [Tsukamurella soli]|uniref:Amino acid deaminase n=1 Tax=Tsukamurella soli TaxID=644556 RepID=A0ABP8KDU4_9ACTN
MAGDTTLPGRPAGRLNAVDKAVPPWADGLTVEEFLAREPRLSSLGTPLLVLDDDAIEDNLVAFAAYCAEHELDLAPHGKTTMSPTLWRRQLAAGSTAITVANYPQLRVAVAAGVPRVHLANAIADPGGVAWLGAALDADPGLEVEVWADSEATVTLLADALAGARRPLTVLVEVGSLGARTGARTLEEAVAVGEAIAASPRLRLGGVAGYEGAVAHDVTPTGLARVDAYLETMAAVHRRLADSYSEDGPVVVSAGGSAYFDRVAAVLGPLRDDRTKVELRSGVYVIHDDGFYASVAPADRGIPAPRLRSAMRIWARVLSRPEPTLVLLDVGRRDVSFDDGLPVPQVAATTLGGPQRPLVGAVATAINDQHLFLTVPADDPVAVGDVVGLGASHPCTVMDKWRTVPVVRGRAGHGDDPVVVDLVATYF